MGWFKIKIRPVDRLYSQVIRKRDKMLCKYNFQCFKGTLGSQTSHFQKRSKESVRCDLENGDWCCAKCHYFIENDPEGQKTLEQWKRKQLGETAYKLLILRANDDSKKHKDDKLNEIILKEILKTLN
jgi:hypothetical protein